MFEITEILRNGCVMITKNGTGAPFIETGDYDRLGELLSDGDIQRVRNFWTKDVISFRKSEVEKQAQPAETPIPITPTLDQRLQATEQALLTLMMGEQ